MIYRQGSEPLYQQLADTLRDRIARQEFMPGDQLPAEPDMAHDYGVGIDTIRDALAVLKHEGLIVTRRGYRAVVAGPIEKNVVVLEPHQHVEARMPTPAERKRLDMLPGVPVLLVVNADGTGDLYPSDRIRIDQPPS